MAQASERDGIVGLELDLPHGSGERKGRGRGQFNRDLRGPRVQPGRSGIPAQALEQDPMIRAKIAQRRHWRHRLRLGDDEHRAGGTVDHGRARHAECWVDKGPFRYVGAMHRRSELGAPPQRGTLPGIIRIEGVHIVERRRDEHDIVRAFAGHGQPFYVQWLTEHAAIDLALEQFAKAARAHQQRIEHGLGQTRAAATVVIVLRQHVGREIAVDAPARAAEHTAGIGCEANRRGLRPAIEPA
jgi:hypothetical protein